MTEKDAMETHPNFTIVCDKCSSKIVFIENDIGFSAESGSWGGVRIVCNDCENTVTIVGH